MSGYRETGKGHTGSTVPLVFNKKAITRDSSISVDHCQRLAWEQLIYLALIVPLPHIETLDSLAEFLGTYQNMLPSLEDLLIDAVRLVLLPC